ncbi:MAG: methyltransferase domain-containing protein [Bacillota bacterium]|nr:methyltransferase domain-containing protein [Bacillota bacterium]
MAEKGSLPDAAATGRPEGEAGSPLWRAVAWILLGLAVVDLAQRVRSRLRPGPMPARIQPFFLESRLRALTLGPQHVLPALELAPGLDVLEVGVGTGFLTPSLARAVEPGGHLVGLDVQPDHFERIRWRLEEAGLRNVELVQGDAQRLPFPDASFDRVVMVTVLGEVPDRRRALAEAGRVLRPGGRLCVTEHAADPDFLTPGCVERLGREAGLVALGRLGGWFRYTLCFSRAEGGA